MKSTAAFALLASTTEAYRLNHKSNRFHPVSFLQTNTRWIELPDCGVITAGDGQVALKADLSNAVFATCKSYNPSYVPPDPTQAPPPDPTAEQAYQSSYGTNYTFWQPAPIYDPIFHTKEWLQEHEHQIVQHQDGHIETTDGSLGPHGDWYMYGKPLSGTEWPREAPIVSLAQVFQSDDEPEDIQVVQFESKANKDKKWVELPACDGTAGEKQLKDNLSNAHEATCKVHPDIIATGKKNSAAGALDSLTPKAE